MKKSLILSIVMTLVLVISMSTATFAWYTSSTSATATVNTVTAASGSGNLKIVLTPDGTEALTTNTQNAQAYTFAGQLNPVAPTADLTAWVNASTTTEGVTTYTDVTTAKEGYVESGSIVLSDDSGKITAIKITLSATSLSKVVAADCVIVLVDAEDNIVANTAFNTVSNTEGEWSDDADAVAANATDAEITFSSNATLTYYIWFNGVSMSDADKAGAFTANFAFEGVEA